jgi:hypothetical protein
MGARISYRPTLSPGENGMGGVRQVYLRKRRVCRDDRPDGRLFLSCVICQRAAYFIDQIAKMQDGESRVVQENWQHFRRRVKVPIVNANGTAWKPILFRTLRKCRTPRGRSGLPFPMPRSFSEF